MATKIPLSAGQAQQLDDASYVVALHIENPEEKLKLTELLSKVEETGTEIERWDRLNRAQQAIAVMLPDAAIACQFNKWMQQARLLQLPTLNRHEKFETDAILTTENSLTKKRDALLDLVQATQLAYRQLRSGRELRKSAARSLVLKGGVLSVVAVAFILLAATSPWWSLEVDALKNASMGTLSMFFTLGLVASFGLLGAFFSRLMAFQSRMGALTLSEFLATYQNNVMWVRLVFGGIGAIVFYLTVRANLIGGTALPDFSKMREFSPCGVLPKDASTLTVHTEFAKLMIWSFIAGFSERLVSSSLDSIEGRAGKPSDASNQKPSS